MDATALVDPSMLAFLALLPRALVTFFYALAALLRFFIDGTVESAHQSGAPAALLGWSLAAFVVASAALLVDLGLEWHGGNRRRDGQVARRKRQVRRLDRDARFRRALAQLLLDPSDASRTELRQLIKVDCSFDG
jgi:zona occludens toxin (predicted ATPase)